MDCRPLRGLVWLIVCALVFRSLRSLHKLDRIYKIYKIEEGQLGVLSFYRVNPVNPVYFSAANLWMLPDPVATVPSTDTVRAPAEACRQIVAVIKLH